MQSETTDPCNRKSQKEKNDSKNYFLTQSCIHSSLVSETVVKVGLVGAVCLLVPLPLHAEPVVPAVLPASAPALREGSEGDLGQSGVGLRHQVLFMALLVLPRLRGRLREVLGRRDRGGPARGRERESVCV